MTSTLPIRPGLNHLASARDAGHGPRAYGLPQQRGELSKPRRWIEPMACRDDAISEARRIAQEESPFRVGFAWECMGRWYAADMKPAQGDMARFTGMGEVVTIEAGGE